MNDLKTDFLIIGIGNSGRQDDGLGWAFLDAIKDKVPDKTHLLYRYQLNVEDAEMISSIQKVLFVDARKRDIDIPFSFNNCLPKESFEFTTHALGPEVVVALCQNLYHVFPEAYLLTIAGEKWELAEGLSKSGQKNLKKALEYFNSTILPALIGTNQAERI